MKSKVILVAALLALAGCNTVAGLGDDISGTARTIQDWI